MMSREERICVNYLSRMHNKRLIKRSHIPSYWFVFIMLLLSINGLGLAAEDDPLIGKTYWVKPNEYPFALRDLDKSVKQIKILHEYTVYSYEVETSPSGEKRVFRKNDVRDAVRLGSLLPYDPVAKSKKDAATAAANRSKAESARVAKIKAQGWPPDIENAVIRREIILGMTADQVRMSLGSPRRVNRTVHAGGTREQWVYGDSAYVYLENDRLRSWQDSR